MAVCVTDPICAWPSIACFTLTLEELAGLMVPCEAGRKLRLLPSENVSPGFFMQRKFYILKTLFRELL
jgi:hypothetical protein